MSETLNQRVKTGILIAIPILFLILFNDLTRVIFLGLILILTAYEFNDLNYRKTENKYVFLLPSILISIVILVLAYLKPELVKIVYIGLLFNILLLLDLLFFKKNILLKLPWITSVLYTSVALSAFIAFRQFPYFGTTLIGTLLLIWTSDIGAYFVGKNIGKNKLMPSVSPGKTWEGFIGAGVLSLLVSFVLFKTMGHFSLYQWATIAILVWIFGSLGDLVESQMKRKLKIKDSGTILPGHGGFLDRFDGFYFCIPFVLTYIIYFSN